MLQSFMFRTKNYGLDAMGSLARISEAKGVGAARDGLVVGAALRDSVKEILCDRDVPAFAKKLAGLVSDKKIVVRVKQNTHLSSHQHAGVSGGPYRFYEIHPTASSLKIVLFAPFILSLEALSLRLVLDLSLMRMRQIARSDDDLEVLGDAFVVYCGLGILRMNAASFFRKIKANDVGAEYQLRHSHSFDVNRCAAFVGALDFSMSWDVRRWQGLVPANYFAIAKRVNSYLQKSVPD